MTGELLSGTNPYVGPRTFTRAEGSRFFGREREARELLSLVISQRLVLFYAQSGAGKSSLLNTRLAPQLEAEGFVVLPVGRVGGALPAGAGQVSNPYLFSLLLSLDRSGGDPVRLAGLELADFLSGLTSDDGENWRYDSPAGAAAAGDAAAYVVPHTVLIVDQFEEIFTTHTDRWPERAAFFTQLDRALQADPHLWVVLTLREDYVAALDPYAPLLTDKLRARYYMERMGADAALDAVRRPAELGGRPFAPGVAEKLVDDLRQVRVPGQEATVPGQYVEPVQLQVVCFQLWERLGEAGVGGQGLGVGDEELGVGGQGSGAGDEELGVGGQGLEVGDRREYGGGELAWAPAAGGLMITEGDLGAAGDVNQALEQFYTDTLAAVLADEGVAAAGVSERALRTWFDKELLTEGGIRNTVLRNDSSGRTGSLPNAAVDALARRFLLRSELRGGGAWVELVHDRFVEPIRTNNAVWFPEHLSTLQRQADLWRSQGRPDGLLLSGDALLAAETWAATQAEGLEPHEQEFLAACQAERATAEREQRQTRRIRMLFVAAVIISILAIGTAALAWNQTRRAQTNAALAEARIAQVGKLVRDLGIERLLSLAGELDKAGDTNGATTLLQTAANANPNVFVDLDLNTLNPDSLRLLTSVAGHLASEQLLSLACDLDDVGDTDGAMTLLQTAVDQNRAVLDDLDLKALNDDALRLLASFSLHDKNGGEYVLIPAGEFTMGSDDRDSLASSDEKPPHAVNLPAYWIGRTEVTNAQYARCVEAGACEPPANSDWNKLELAQHPVTHVKLSQVESYAKWVGGRLPTEAEWEKACRGTDGRIYPWGNAAPYSARLNYNANVGHTTEVGRYPAGANGLYDMAGNVSEVTDRNPFIGRGGSWSSSEGGVRCASSYDSWGGSAHIEVAQNMGALLSRFNADNRYDVLGFRVVLASHGF